MAGQPYTAYVFTLRACDITNPTTGLTTFGFELSDGVGTYYDHSLVYSLSNNDDNYSNYYDTELLKYALRNESYEIVALFNYIKDNKEDLIINRKKYSYEEFLYHYFWLKEENLL